MAEAASERGEPDINSAIEEAKLGKYNHVLLIQDLSPPFQGTAQTM